MHMVTLNSPADVVCVSTVDVFTRQASNKSDAPDRKRPLAVRETTKKKEWRCGIDRKRG